MRSQCISAMEMFQNVDNWLLSVDGGSAGVCWETEQEEREFVVGLDDDVTHVPHIEDGLGCYSITDGHNSPVLNTSLSECWLDMNEILPCDNNKTLDELLTAWPDGCEFGTEVCSVERDCGQQQAQVGISVLESLLLMDTHTETGTGGEQTGCVTVDKNQLKADHDKTFVTEFDCMKDEPAIVSRYDDDDTEDSSSGDNGEDDSHDTTWSYHSQKPRLQRSQRRVKLVRRLSHQSSKSDERKKQQNKSAATRYREKKRSQEIENEVLCCKLERRNKELRSRVHDMTQEVSVLRKLVVDIFRNPNIGSEPQ